MARVCWLWLLLALPLVGAACTVWEGEDDTQGDDDDSAAGDDDSAA